MLGDFFGSTCDGRPGKDVGSDVCIHSFLRVEGVMCVKAKCCMPAECDHFFSLSLPPCWNLHSGRVKNTFEIKKRDRYREIFSRFAGDCRSDSAKVFGNASRVLNTRVVALNYFAGYTVSL